MEKSKNKFMDSIAFIILQSIVNGLLIVLSFFGEGENQKIFYIIMGVIPYNKITDRIYLLDVLALLNRVQLRSLQIFIVTVLLSIVISIMVTFIIWNIIRIFKNNISFRDMIYVTGVWSIIMFPVMILPSVLFLIGIKAAIVFYIISSSIIYICIVYRYLHKVNE